MIVSLIAAMTDARVIGNAGALPWRIPEELKAFKRITTGHAIVMGRKTWESIGRPLPGRLNVVITRQRDYQANGAVVVPSLAAAFELAEARQAEFGDEIFVIGGSEIYREALPHADRIYLTRVNQAFEGDTYFPDFDEAAYDAQRTGEGTFPVPYSMWLLERRAIAPLPRSADPRGRERP